MPNEIHYEISAKNQISCPRILTDSQTNSHALRIVCLSCFVCDLRNFPFRICGSTVVKMFQTSFNFEPIKSKALLYEENDLSFNLQLDSLNAS
jgi:hypothetical protein